MKTLIYKGSMRETKRGCSACGKRNSSTNLKFQRNTEVMLPSGIIKTVTLNVPFDVSDSDADFLLDFEYTLQGKKYKSFIEYYA